MSRRLATVGHTVTVAALLAVTAYVLIASVQNTDHPAVSAAALAAYVTLAFAAFLVALALYVAVQLGIPRARLCWRRRAGRRAVRRMARDRARRMQRRHAAPIGGVR